MPAGAYYNEHDAFAAEWLRKLIALDMIAPGDVDERSIEDVCPDDLRGYRQHHFFAGIGVWSAALRGAGWPDERPVWTGSCPCQPFSAAGKGGGFDDERHLWPAWFWLVRELRPDVLFGEQVASPPGLAWFDLVSADLEGEAYALAAADLCAAGVGAPHIRQRLFFVAHGSRDERQQRGPDRPGYRTSGEPTGLRDAGSSPMASADGRDTGAERQQRSGQHGQQPEDGGAGPVVDAAGEQAGIPGRTRQPGGPGGGLANTAEERQSGFGAQRDAPDGQKPAIRAGSPAWTAPDWIPCRDGKWRPVESGTFPLAHGAPCRVGRLRGYGNALAKPVAEAFIEAAMSVLP